MAVLKKLVEGEWVFIVNVTALGGEEIPTPDTADSTDWTADSTTPTADAE